MKPNQTFRHCSWTDSFFNMRHRYLIHPVFIFLVFCVGTYSNCLSQELSPRVVPPELQSDVLAYAKVVQAKVKSQWVFYENNKGRKARVAFAVNPDGTLSKAAIIKSSGNSDFDASAIRAVHKAQGLPAPPAQIAHFLSVMHLVFDDAEPATSARDGPEKSHDAAGSNNDQNFLGLILLCALLLIGLTLVQKSTVVVKQGQVGIRERLGRYVDTLEPGFHFKVPLIDFIFPVSMLSAEYLLESQTVSDKDGKMGTVDVRLVARVENAAKAQYSIDDPKLRLPTLAISTLRDLVRTLSIQGLGSELSRLENILQDSLSKTLRDWGMKLEELKIENFKA
jgi:TonB family protein